MVVFHQIKHLPGNENEKGLKSLLAEALEMKPLSDLPNPLDLDWVDTAKNWNLKDTLNDVSGGWNRHGTSLCCLTSFVVFSFFAGHSTVVATEKKL